MAFATIAATNTSETASSGTTHTVSLPASISAGQLLVIAISFNANVTATLPATWAAELVDNGDANATGLWIAYKFASGSEGASVAVTSSGSAQSTHASARFTGMHASSAPEAGTVAVIGNLTTHNPTGVTPSWGSADNVFMAVFGWRNSARTVSSYPTDYTDNQTTKNNSAGGNSTGIAFATRNLTATSDDPGAMTLTAGSVGQCITLAIRPSGGATTVTADAGSYSLTGSAASLTINRPIVAGAGSYALTGTTAALTHAFKLPAAAGAYNLTGTAAGLKHAWKLPAGSGSYTITGSVANLIKSGSGNKSLPVDPGTYTLTGTAVGLKFTRRIPVTSGSYALTGTAAGLKLGRNLPTTSGSYALTGSTANLRHAWRISAATGSYLFTGTAATLKHGYQLITPAGSYTINGESVTFSFTHPYGRANVSIAGVRASVSGSSARPRVTTSPVKATTTVR